MKRVRLEGVFSSTPWTLENSSIDMRCQGWRHPIVILRTKDRHALTMSLQDVREFEAALKQVREEIERAVKQSNKRR